MSKHSWVWDEIRAGIAFRGQIHRGPAGLGVEHGGRRPDQEVGNERHVPGVLQSARERHEFPGVRVEDAAHLGLHALRDPVSPHHEDAADAECDGADQVALQRDAVSVAAGHVQDGVDSPAREQGCGSDTRHVHLGPGIVGYLNGVDEFPQDIALPLQGVGIGRAGEVHVCRDDEVLRAQRLPKAHGFAP